MPGKRIEFQYGEQAPIIREFNRISAREKRERFLALYEALNHLYMLHCEGVFALDDKNYVAITKAAAALAKAEGNVIAK